METTSRQDFQTRCAQVAAVFEQSGARVTKAPREMAVVVSGNAGTSVSFPIVSDERDWRETTPEEALYAALTDLHAWTTANLDDATLATLDATEKTEVPLMQRDLADEAERLRVLAQVVGGMDVVRHAWQAGGIA